MLGEKDEFTYWSDTGPYSSCPNSFASLNYNLCHRGPIEVSFECNNNNSYVTLIIIVSPVTGRLNLLNSILFTQLVKHGEKTIQKPVEHIGGHIYSGYMQEVVLHMGSPSDVTHIGLICRGYKCGLYTGAMHRKGL